MAIASTLSIRMAACSPRLPGASAKPSLRPGPAPREGGMTEVSLRERVKEPPSAALVESYYRPALARARAHVLAQEMWAHLAHGQMLERQGILAPGALPPILGRVL